MRLWLCLPLSPLSHPAHQSPPQAVFSPWVDDYALQRKSGYNNRDIYFLNIRASIKFAIILPPTRDVLISVGPPRPFSYIQHKFLLKLVRRLLGLLRCHHRYTHHWLSFLIVILTHSSCSLVQILQTDTNALLPLIPTPIHVLKTFYPLKDNYESIYWINFLWVSLLT